VRLIQRLTRAHVAQGGVTLGPEQGELGANFCYLGNSSNLSTSKHRCHSILFRPLRSEDTQPLQMAGSSRKASSKSPKRTRQNKAAASETESASPSPKKIPRSKADACETEPADFSNEDYNIRSPKGTELLTKIKDILNGDSVSPALWTCF
jgi:hypothetical protein